MGARGRAAVRHEWRREHVQKVVDDIELLACDLDDLIPTSEAAALFLDTLLAVHAERMDRWAVGFTLTSARDLPEGMPARLLYGPSEDLVVTEICLMSSCCAGCLPVTDSMLETQAEDAPAVAEYRGICGVLAVAHSILKLGLVSEADATEGEDGAKKFKKSFLDEVWRAAGGHATGGCTPSEQRDAHRAYNDQEGVNVTCTGDDKPDQPHGDEAADGTVTQAELQAWCERLQQRLGEEKDDCALGLRGATAGHRMMAESAAWNAENGKCEIGTVNTGRQGDGDGENVPYNPGDQTWEIGANDPADGQTDVDISAGDTTTNFWDGLGFHTPTFYCCSDD